MLGAFKENVANLQDDEGQRPLHTASAEGRQEMVELLIASGAKVNSVDKQLWTPLHYACKEGCVFKISSSLLLFFLFTRLFCSHLEIAKLLLDHNAELIASDNGTTPLHYFARIDPSAHDMKLYTEVLDGLLRKNGAVNLQTSSGETALHQACMRPHGSEAVKQLLQRGANPNIATKYAFV